MGKGNKNRGAVRVPQATEVEIEFHVTLKEVHCRTGTQCDKRSQNFSSSLEHDFELAAAWLKTDLAEAVFDELCGEIGHYLDAGSGGGR
jgi:hypothetical protein